MQLASFEFTLCILMTLANSEDQDEMPHIAAFHQGYNVYQDKNSPQRKKCKFLKPSIYIYWTIPSVLYQTRSTLRVEEEYTINISRRHDMAFSSALSPDC